MVEFKDIVEKEDLMRYFEQIADLFNVCFGKALDREMWEWAYINNPFGNPIVSMAWNDGKLIGHYAVIPMNLESSSGTLIGFLSMTTMVSTVTPGLFANLANRVYRVIELRNEPAVVFGFPNEQSLGGFKRLLGWEINDDYGVFSVRKENIESIKELLSSMDMQASFFLDMENVMVSEWRTRKPKQSWIYSNGLGLKKFRDNWDVMHISSPEKLELLKKEVNANMLLPAGENCIKKIGAPLMFKYRFGVKLINTKTIPSIFPQMSLSDVF